MFVYETKYLKKGDKVRVKSRYHDDPFYARYFIRPFEMSQTIDYKNVIFIVDIIDTESNGVLIREQNGKRGAWVPCHSVEKVNKVFNGLEE